MRKFLLADPSIVDLGGHYLEYTTRVLKAVEADGYEPYLAVNAAFNQRIAASLPWPLIATFRYDIWGHDPSRTVALIAEPSDEERQTLRRMTSLGSLYWALAENGSITRHYTERVGMPAHRLRRFEQALGLVDAVYSFEKEMLSAYSGKPTFPIWFRARMEAIRKALAQRQNAPQETRPSHRADLSRLYQTREATRTFAAGLRDLTTKLGLDQDDIIFLPTASWADIAGVVDYLSHVSPERAPYIAPILRRNIFNGSPDTYVKQSYAVHDFRWLLSHANRQAGKSKLVICTDTEELSQQYREITPAVITLPVATPEMPRAPAPWRETGTITLGYIGDARQEKGFHHLGSLLERLTLDELSTPVKLKSQAYTPKGPQDLEILRAIELLRLRVPQQVELVETALGSEEYIAQLVSCDALLVLYDQNNYAARSSGVFVEALCARRPVIVTAGTSMAALLDAEAYGYHSRRIRPMSVLSLHLADELQWWQMTPEGDVAIQHRPNEVSVAPSFRPHTVVPCPAGANYVWLTFSVNASTEGLFTSVFVAQRNNEREIKSREFVLGGRHAKILSLVVPLEKDADDIWVSFGPSGAVTGYSLQNLAFRFFQDDQNIARVPGGVTVTRLYPPEEGLAHIVDATRELARDFDAILASAEEFGDKFGPTQTPQNLVRTLIAEIDRRRGQEASALAVEQIYQMDAAAADNSGRH